MKSSIKTCLVKSERIVSLTKSTICTAVILSLGFTANLSAAPTITFTLDADSLATGTYPASSPLTFSSPGGDVTFVGEILNGVGDPGFGAAGASGNTFNILDPGTTPDAQTAELFFGFDVISIEFIYGGNHGAINVEAQDEYGVVVMNGTVAQSFSQATGINLITGLPQPAGPETLSGSGITSLYWTDPVADQGYAALDNIEVTVGVIPSPSAAILAGIGVSFVGWLRRRKVV